MSTLAIVHARRPDGGWRPVGVMLGTPNRLDLKFLPGEPGWQRWAEGIAANANPVITGPGRTGGNWETWVRWAADAFSNAADIWLTRIDDPEPGVEANYTKRVLQAQPTPGTVQTVVGNEIPELGGFRKVKPA